MRMFFTLGLLLLVVAFGLLTLPSDKVVFLDVGQGDAILLQNGTRQVLIDGGPGMSVLTRLGEEMPFLDRRVEVVVLTHPQRDHMEGLLHVLERYDVGLVVLPWATNTSQMQEHWLTMITERGVPYRFAWAGQQLHIGDMAFTVLGPFDSEEGRAAARSDVNNASVVTRVDYGGLSLLLTGDAEKSVEKLLVENYVHAVLDVAVLKAGHHGSDSSTTQALIAVVRPELVVISVGEANRFGHPKQAVLDRLAPLAVWRTDHHGSIRLTRVDGQWLLSCVKTCTNSVTN